MVEKQNTKEYFFKNITLSVSPVLIVQHSIMPLLEENENADNMEHAPVWFAGLGWITSKEYK